MSYLPELPEHVPDTVLIICLCLPPADDGLKRLDNTLQSYLQQPKTRNAPDVTIVSVVNCKGQKRLEKEKNDGSMAELFATGRMAREKGWASVGIVDNLTYRLLCGQRLPGEKDVATSMIILQTRPPDENAETGKAAIKAKRFLLQESLHILTQDEGININPSINRTDCRQISNLYRDIYSEFGLGLHDWNLPLFRNSSVRWREYAKTVDRVLSLKPSLPVEMVDTIQDELEAPEPLECLTEAPVILKSEINTLKFHALVPFADMAASTAALNEMVRAIKPDVTAVIYPWKKPFLPPSRCDFWRLWQRILQFYHERHYPVALFLDTDPAAATKDDDADLDVILAERRAGYAAPTLVSRVPLLSGIIVSFHGNCYLGPPLGNCGDKEDDVYALPTPTAVECFVEGGPSARFFHDPPPWRCIGDTWGRSTDAHPCFFLTRGDEECSVDEMVQLMHDHLNDDTDVEEGFAPYAFVPWEGEEDGGIEDVVRLAAMCWDEGHRVQDPVQHCIFVDREAWRTKKVMYVRYKRPLGPYSKWDYEEHARAIERDETLDEETKYRRKFEMYKEGIIVVRADILEEDLYHAWAGITTANTDFEEFFDVSGEIEKYERPWKSEEEKRLAFEVYEVYKR